MTLLHLMFIFQMPQLQETSNCYQKFYLSQLSIGLGTFNIPFLPKTEETLLMACQCLDISPEHQNSVIVKAGFRSITCSCKGQNIHLKYSIINLQMESVKNENFAETCQTGSEGLLLCNTFLIFIFPSSHTPRTDFKENQIKRNLFQIQPF